MNEHIRAIVTGGAGVIGSHLVEALLAQGATVMVIDDLSSGSLANLVNQDSTRLEIYQRDVRDPSLLELYQEYQPEMIFHLAARYANQMSLEDPREDLSVNTGGTLNQLLLAVKCRVKRFLYASTSCVYANSKEALTEASPLQPHTPYGISKLTGEVYCRFFQEYYQLSLTMLRYFNSYGAREAGNDYRGVVPRFICNALQGKALTITGNGAETRDFTYVADTIRGTLLAAFSPSGIGEVFNIGTGVDTPILRLAEEINQLTGNKLPIKYQPLRDWDQTINRRADLSKAKKLLGFRPKYSLKEGLALTIPIYQEFLVKN